MRADGIAAARWRRPVMASGAVAVMALAVHGAGWWWVTGQIETGWLEGVGVARSYGWEVTSGPASRGGWPGVASVQRSDVVATRPLGDATLRVRFEKLAIGWSMADLRAVRVEALGLVSVSVGDGPPLSLRAESAVLRAPARGPVTVAVRGLEAADPERRGFAVARLDVLLDDAAATVAATGMEGRPPLPQPFEGGGGVSFRVAVTPRFPLAATPAASVAQWQGEGGKVTVPALAIRWGPLVVDGHAAGGLDAGLQPQVEGSLDTQGVGVLLNAAAKAGVLARPVVQATQAVLGILAMSAGGGAVRLPFKLSGGTLTVAQFPLARLPRVEWGPR